MGGINTSQEKSDENILYLARGERERKKIMNEFAEQRNRTDASWLRCDGMHFCAGNNGLLFRSIQRVGEL